MSGLMLCKKQTDKPLYIEEAGVNIYSIEELCYYLRHNLYSVDETFFDENLFEFLEEVDEPVICTKIKNGMLSQKRYLVLVYDLLLATDYFSREEKEEIGQELQVIMNRTPAENMKAKADLLKKRKLYAKALESYKNVIEDETLRATEELLAAVWNNIGTIHAENFCYQKAYQCFEKAMAIHTLPQYLENMVYAVLFWEKSGDEIQEIDNIKRNLEVKYEITQQLLDEYQTVIGQKINLVAESEKLAQFQKQISYDNRKTLDEYYNDMSRIVSMWKKEYRDYREERQS